tara:strand:+ start:540 stop:3707 length:3168 start_codon:yes stop_codon:yes gene_type:complete
MQSQMQRILIRSAGVVGVGVLLTYGLWSQLTPGNQEADIINEFVAIEHSTGAVQVLAGATTDGSIFTKSGSLIVGPLDDPWFEVTSTGDTLLNKIRYMWPAADGSNGQQLTTGADGTLSWAAAEGVGNTDDQVIDVLTLVSNTFSISLEDDGEATKTLDFTGLDHDALTNFVANEHISWVVGDGASANFETTGSMSGGSLIVQGAMTGQSLSVTGLANCDTIDTDANGNMTCGTDADTQHGNGANCAAGEIALGVDANGAVEGCYEPTEADITDLVHTTDTNANTICAGTTVYLDGEGNCDTLTDTDTTYTAGEGLDLTGTVFSRNPNLTGDTLTVRGTMTGYHLHVSGTMSGAGLVDCDTAATSKLLWDATTEVFSCGTDTDTDTDTQLTEEEVEDFVGGMLGGTETHISVTYQDGTNDIDFVVDPDSVAGAISEGALTNDSILEADLKAVDTASDEECLTFESTTGDFEWQTCGGAAGGFTGTGALQAFFDNRYVLEQGDTMTGALIINPTTATAEGDLEVAGLISGTTLHIGNLLTGSGYAVFRNITDSTTSFQINDADGGNPVLSVDTVNERVGIGTVSPEMALHVVDDLTTVGQFVGSNAAYARIVVDASTSGADSQISLAEEGSTRWSIGRDDSNSNALAISQSAALGTNQRVTITTAGNVGIGTTSPDTLLEVIGVMSGVTVYAKDALRSSGALVVDGDASIKGILSGAIVKAATSLTSSGTLAVEKDARFNSGVTIQTATDAITAFQILDNDGGNPVLSVDTTNERVGIGTASPSAKFHIDSTGDQLYLYGGANSNIRFYAGWLQEFSTTGGSGISSNIYYDGSYRYRQSDVGVHLHIGNGEFDFRTSASGTAGNVATLNQRMIITNAGKVGIGTALPTETLEVVGTISGSTLHAQDLFTSSGSFFLDTGDVNWDSTNRTSMFGMDSDEDAIMVNTTGTGGHLTTSGSLAHNIKNMSGSFTLDRSHGYMMVDASGTSPTKVTLPTCSSVYDRFYHIKRLDDSANMMEIKAASGDRIDGSGTLLMHFQYDAVKIGCSRYDTGTGWYIF